MAGVRSLPVRAQNLTFFFFFFPGYISYLASFRLVGRSLEVSERGKVSFGIISVLVVWNIGERMGEIENGRLGRLEGLGSHDRNAWVPVLPCGRSCRRRVRRDHVAAFADRGLDYSRIVCWINVYLDRSLAFPMQRHVIVVLYGLAYSRNFFSCFFVY